MKETKIRMSVDKEPLTATANSKHSLMPGQININSNSAPFTQYIMFGYQENISRHSKGYKQKQFEETEKTSEPNIAEM